MSQDEILHSGQYLRMRRRGNWEYAERVNASCAVIIVALTPADELLFVEQYREPIRSRTIEMPAGLVGDVGADERIETAARRELLEETGWACQHIELLMSGPSSSGMSNEMVVFVRAIGLQHVDAGGGDASEDITVHRIPRVEAARWLHGKRMEGYSIDPKLYAGLYFVDRNPDGQPCGREQS